MRRPVVAAQPRSLSRSFRLLAGVCLLGVALPALLMGVAVVPANPSPVSGTVYRDYNANGVRDAREPGVPGIRVLVYAAEGAPFQGLTQSDGTYSVAAGVAGGTPVRVEFDVPAGGFQSGAFGARSGTTVQFVNAPATNIDLGINRPGQYCQAPENLTMVTSCFVGGNNLIGANGQARQDPVLVDVPYLAGRTPPFTGPGDPEPSEHLLMVPSSAVGSVWGLAYQRGTNRYFAGAFLKRHSGFGPGGPGAIYRFDPSVMNGSAELYLDLNALFPGELPAGANTRPQGFTGEQYLVDAASFPQVGKVGFGDLDMFEDDQTLYAIALGNRRLYQIPVGDGTAPPTAAQIRSFAIPDPGTTGPNACPLDPNTPAGQSNLNLRPFGLGIHDGLVYVGVVCTAENVSPPGQSLAARQALLRAYVYAFDPAAAGGGAFAAQPALSFPLNYPRGCLEISRCDDVPAQWRPWNGDFNSPDVIEFPFRANEVLRWEPEPWLVGITFDGDEMVLGFRDRAGDKYGSFAGSVTNPPTVNGTPYYVGAAGGDVLRACRAGAGSWVIEGSNGCAVPPQPPQPRPQGPGGPEYYYTDNHPFHDEVVNGGLVVVPGFTEVAVSANDPINASNEIFQGGVRWFRNVADAGGGPGTTAWAYRLYQGAISPPVDLGLPPEFGKTNGLGDLEPACAPAPVEIGNRVWFDLNRNGVQDANEQPTPGVRLRLYDGQGRLVSTAVTNARGEYVFRGGPASGDTNPNDEIGELAGPVAFNARYRIQIEPAGNWDAPGAPLRDWYPTAAEGGTSTIRDSNGRWQSTGTGVTNGLVFAEVVTGRAGFNNHTFDFGFIQEPTSVRLSAFTATLAEGGAEVRWSTSAELDTWGFHLYRSTTRDRATAVRVTPDLISSQGSGGGSYVFQDRTAVNGTTYYYWLQEIELNGTVNEYGPTSTTTLADLGRRLYLPFVRTGDNR